MPQILLKQAKQASPWMMLCGVSVVFNSLGDVVGLMSCKRSSENVQELVGFQSTEAFGCLHHTGGGPAQRHRGVSPLLHVALGFIGIVALPSLPERPAYRRMQRLGQPLDQVAGFMRIGVWAPEGATDDFAQRLGAVDDEQPAYPGIEPALDQVVDERLH